MIIFIRRVEEGIEVMHELVLGMYSCKELLVSHRIRLIPSRFPLFSSNLPFVDMEIYILTCPPDSSSR